MTLLAIGHSHYWSGQTATVYRPPVRPRIVREPIEITVRIPVPVGVANLAQLAAFSPAVELQIESAAAVELTTDVPTEVGQGTDGRLNLTARVAVMDRTTDAELAAQPEVFAALGTSTLADHLVDPQIADDEDALLPILIALASR